MTSVLQAVGRYCSVVRRGRVVRREGEEEERNVESIFTIDRRRGAGGGE